MSTTKPAATKRSSRTIPRQRTAGTTAPGRTPAPAPTRRSDRRRMVLALSSVVVALAAATSVLVVVLTGGETSAPVSNEPYVSKLPQGIDGSDAHLYQRANERSNVLPEGMDGSDAHLYQRARERQVQGGIDPNVWRQYLEAQNAR